VLDFIEKIRYNNSAGNRPATVRKFFITEGQRLEETQPNPGCYALSAGSDAVTTATAFTFFQAPQVGAWS
jgi:hypothetical protein